MSGSGAMFSDQFLEKEDNAKILEVIFDFLTSDKIELNKIDSEDPEITDYHMIPNTPMLSDRLRTCLQVRSIVVTRVTVSSAHSTSSSSFLCSKESDEIPSAFTRLFNTRLFSISTSLVPSAIKSYHELNVKHEPLKLITPQFETPLPPLQAAVFPPSFRFDL